MTDKNLRYFMRPEAKEERTIMIPAPDTILDEDGNPVMMEVKVLHSAHTREIMDAYRERTVAVDKKKNPIISNGEIVYKVKKDNEKAFRHVIAEALVYPDLNDKALQEFFNCYDKVEMVDKVFPTMKEFSYVSQVILDALGIGPDVEEEDDDEEIADAKN